MITLNRYVSVNLFGGSWDGRRVSVNKSEFEVLDYDPVDVRFAPQTMVAEPKAEQVMYHLFGVDLGTRDKLGPLVVCYGIPGTSEQMQQKGLQALFGHYFDRVEFNLAVVVDKYLPRGR